MPHWVWFFVISGFSYPLSLQQAQARAWARRDGAVGKECSVMQLSFDVWNGDGFVAIKARPDDQCRLTFVGRVQDGAGQTAYRALIVSRGQKSDLFLLSHVVQLWIDGVFLEAIQWRPRLPHYRLEGPCNGAISFRGEICFLDTRLDPDYRPRVWYRSAS